MASHLTMSHEKDTVLSLKRRTPYMTSLPPLLRSIGSSHTISECMVAGAAVIPPTQMYTPILRALLHDSFNAEQSKASRFLRHGTGTKDLELILAAFGMRHDSHIHRYQ